MIEARSRDTRGLGARLAAKAARIARSHAENRLRKLRADPARWRKAALLWPLFTKD